MFRYPVNFNKIKKLNLKSYINSPIGNLDFNLYSFTYILRKILFKLKLYYYNNYSELIDSDIKKILNKQKTSGGLFNWYSFIRLCELVIILKKFKIISCLEFGSGSTSYFLKKYSKNHLSIEENLKWKKKTLNLNKNIRIIHSKRIIKKFKNEACSMYKIKSNKKIFKQNYNLVYIDGPTSKNFTKIKSLDPKNNTPNVDIFKLFENKIFPKFIIIDGRRSSIRLILKYYNKKYKVYLRNSYQFSSVLNLNTYYHTILIKKD